MRSQGYTGVAIAALLTATPTLAKIDSGTGAPPVPALTAPSTIAPAAGAPVVLPPRPVGPAVKMPAAPPMMAPEAARAASDYRRPSYGYRLPAAWMTPQYFISDYRAYGLAAPAMGFGWSRYYDDAVLTDQWGRVYDAQSDVEWDRRGERDGDRRGHGGFGSRETDGLAGGIGGAAVGAVAGNLIGGAGSRLAGSLIGGGVGALAGLALEAALAKDRHHRHRDHSERGYEGGRYRSDYSRGPHWGGNYYGGYQGGGYYQSGYDAPSVTTVVVNNSAPAAYRTVTSYETVYVRRAVKKRHFRPRPKAACACGS